MSWFVRKYRRLAEIWQWQGPFALLLHGLEFALAPVLVWDVSYAYALDLRPPLPPADPSGTLTLKFYTGLQDLGRLQRELAQRGDVTPAEVESRLARGDVVVVAYVADVAVAYDWLCWSPRSAQERERTLILGPTEVYQYGSFVFPEWRGKALHRVVSIAASRWAQDRGFLRLITYVSIWNRPSIRTHLRMGKKKTGTVWSLRFRWQKRAWSWATRKS